MEATQAMDLEGLQFRGESLKIGRPANYNPLAQQANQQPVKKLDTSTNTTFMYY